MLVHKLAWCSQFATKFEFTQSWMWIQEQKTSHGRGSWAGGLELPEAGNRKPQSLREWESVTVRYLGEDRITLAGTRGRRNSPKERMADQIVPQRIWLHLQKREKNCFPSWILQFSELCSVRCSQIENKRHMLLYQCSCNIWSGVVSIRHHCYRH